MTFSIQHTDGSSDETDDITCLDELYNELLLADAEHFDVAVFNDECGYAIAAYPSGHVTLIHFSTLEQQEWHLYGMTKADVVELWQHLAVGDMSVILAHPWQSKPN